MGSAVGERPMLLLAAWSIIALLALMIIVTEYFQMTTGWINHFWYEHNSLEGWYTNKASNLGLYPPVIFDGFFVKQVIFTWPPLLAIALLAIWTRNWPFRSGRAEVGEYDPTTIMAARPTAWQTIKHQGTLFFTYQLPPRKFWNWFLDGGFNVIDFIVVAIYLSLAACWMYFSYMLDWPYLQAAYKETGVYTNDTKMGDVCEALGYAGAWAAVFHLVFLFIPISRSSFLQYLFNADFSSIIRYHRWWGHATLLFTLLHGLFFYIGWWSVSTKKFRDETFAWQSYSVNYLAGSISFFPFGLVLWLTTIPVVRRKFFKVFWWCHVVGFLGYMIFLEIHYPQSIWYVPGLILYFMDVTFRMAQWRVTSGMQCTFVSADKTFTTIKLKFNKDAKVRTNQFVFINAPSISYFSWHPFSIAAAYPSSDGLSQDVIIHVKSYGSWTQRLVRSLAETGTIPIRVDGPYGAASAPEWAQHNHVVMVAGGIGVTPLLGMLRDIQGSLNARGCDERKKAEQDEMAAGRPPFVNLLWVVRNRDELQLLDQDLLMTAGQPGSWLRLNLFHTGNDPYVEHGTPAMNGFSKLGYTPSSAQQPVSKCLPPYGFGDFHWALAHLLSFLGAFFSCLMVSSYNYEGAITGDNEGEGVNIWSYGLVIFLAFIVGSMGFPALIIFPLQYFRYKKHVKACEQAFSFHQNGHANGGANGHEKVSNEQVKSLIPDNRLTSGALDLETGKSASVSFGRPNLKKLILESIAALDPRQSVGVIVSGPPSLVRDARSATHKAASIASKAGLQGIPELSFSNHSFTL